MATTALVGAGMVALATASSMPDAKPDPSALNPAKLTSANIDAASRQANVDRVSRSLDRSATDASADQAMPELWLLPMQSYALDPSSAKTGGVDLLAAEGTAFYAAHDGTVKLARWCGGYGYCVEVDAGNGTTVLYAHAAQLLVQEGQQVHAGDQLGLTGNTGYSFTPHLHFEIRQNSKTIDAVSYLQAQGVNIPGHSEAIDG